MSSSAEFKPFSGRGQKLDQKLGEAEQEQQTDDDRARNSDKCFAKQQDITKTDEPIQLIDCDEHASEMEDSQDAYDEFSNQHSSIQQIAELIKKDFAATMHEHHDWIESLLEVSNVWVRELPRNKYAEETHGKIEQFQHKAEQFRLEVGDITRIQMPAEAFEDIKLAMAATRKELAMTWKMCQGEVDFLMGRASSEIRKLKREGSDLPDPTDAKSSRSSQ